VLRTTKFRNYYLAAVIVLAAGGALGLYAQEAAPSEDVAASAAANAGWISLFNGTSLDGWDGRSDVWKVEDGAITGEVAAGPSSVTDTTYIFWKGGEPSDFDFKVEIKTDSPFVNSGIVYRGFVQPPSGDRGVGGAGGRPEAARGQGSVLGGPTVTAGGGSGNGGPARGLAPARSPGRAPGGGRGPSNAPYKLGGPQLDFDASNRYSGQYFEIGTDRGLLARRGQIVEVDGTAQPNVIGLLGDDKTMGGYVKPGDWNQVRIIAQGNTLIHMINGHVVAVLVDNDSAKFRTRGLLAFQLEGAGKVEFRNIWLKTN
jgi:Domain of Unknown Function (DUF1080)